MARRRHRLSVTFIVVISLLFAQLALANFVCPKQNAQTMATTMEPGTPCAGMDSEQPALCSAHCSNAPQSTETVKLPTPAAPMLVQVLELPLELEARAASAVPVAATVEAQPPPDPLFLSTLRLRV